MSYIRTPEIREKNRQAVLGRKAPLEQLENQRLGGLRRWSNPDEHERMRGIHRARTDGSWIVANRAAHTPEAKAKRSATMTEENKRRWADPDYKQRVVTKIRSMTHPNKAEVRLAEQLGPTWKFVGNGELIINGKCPDFQSLINPTQLLELFGDYWHRGEDPQARINEFVPFGYQVAVVWEHDIEVLQFPS
jgi:hypothetical protein